MALNTKVFLLTDGCMWEINRKALNEHPHAIEVVDVETGAVRYIKSGSRIAFLEGEITDIRTQDGYNRKHPSSSRKVPPQRKGDVHPRRRRQSKKSPRKGATGA